MKYLKLKTTKRISALSDDQNMLFNPLALNNVI